ncbi:double-strand siRNA ribonuclease Eri1 [Schizosaccharomyces pombe]|uniref:3'-5' exonuclease eri1 n=1 Tax=Schizosaccharomyces pombe (strain 972 / ATCC 24843) TaxID=284812 RepID=ERI1_SCHPO
MNQKTPSTVEEIRIALQELGLSTNGNKEKLKRRWKFREKRLEEKRKQERYQKFSTSNENKTCLRYLLIVDVEATCEEGCGFSFENEIIELPCLLFDLIEKSIIDEFHSYVRPSMNPTLSDYCKSLTGIQQCTVDKAPIFSDVLEELFIFLRKHSNILVPSVDEIEIIEPLKSVPRTQPKNWAWACDGPWDMASFLAKQFKYDKMPIPDWIKGPFVDIRSFYKDVYRVPRTNINGMLEHWGLQFEGSEHRGIDDARNLSRIVKKMCSENVEFECNRWWMEYEKNGWIPNRSYPPYFAS